MREQGAIGRMSLLELLKLVTIEPERQASVTPLLRSMTGDEPKTDSTHILDDITSVDWAA
jgi:hypothetical protein